MKWLNGTKISLVLVGIVAAIVLGGRTVNADFIFGEPVNLGPTINSPHVDYSGSFSSDGLEMYFDSNRSSGPQKDDIYVSTWDTIDDAWGTPVKLGPPVNSSGIDVCPIISTDGLSLYFTSFNRAGGYGNADIWVATRATVSDPWGEPSNLGPTINTSQDDIATFISCDGLVLYFYLKPPAQSPGDIYMSTRPTTNDAWGEPVNLGPTVNSSYSDASSCISANGLLLFFHSNRPGGFGDYDLYMTRRATIDDDWCIPVNLGPAINTSAYDAFATILPDGSTLYFTSNRPGGVGGKDIWQAPIIPIVDFDGDGNVDALDLSIMIDHWGEDYPLCDIGPMPWGDGIVDVEDLEVLSKYSLEDYPLVAYWMFDETDGDIAYDSIGDHDGTLNGNPFWQSTGSMIGGTLLFDGIDDYVETPFILDPAKGSLSVFAWIKCWTPGQVIISQKGEFGGTWLVIDPSGKLMTGFSDTYFGALESESVITDMQWHHVGFVYDMDTLHRRLYVDGVQVAEDATVVSGMPSESGLYIGASKDLDAGTFFSGMIDDVRIYKQALTTEEIAALAQ